MVLAGLRTGTVFGQSRFAVALHTLRVRAIQRQPGEELGCHAASAAAVEERALRAGAGGLRGAQLIEERGTLPNLLESPFAEHVACQEGLVDCERTGIDVT